MTEDPNPDPSKLPRSMEGEGLSIVPNYTEAGYFMEANVVRITDGDRTALYVPYKTVGDPKPQTD